MLCLAFFAVVAFAGLRGPGKYNGVVVFDRWDGCYLYSGIYLMEISEGVKESLRPFKDKAVLIDAQEVHQPINPGDGLIKKLKVRGPAEEPKSPARFGEPPDLQGLSLRVIPSFPSQGSRELIVQLTNNGNVPRRIDTDALGPTLFSKKPGSQLFEPSDGPSYAAVTRMDPISLYRAPAGGSAHAKRNGPKIPLSLIPGLSVPRRVTVEPGESFEMPLSFDLFPGEYQFMAGYGGGVHQARLLVSNRIDFDVDARGAAHLTKDALALNAKRLPHRYEKVCGRVTLENGNPAKQATVSLWPFPFEEDEPRSANSATVDSDGRFHMDSVLEGEYVLSAVRRDATHVLAGAAGGHRPSDGAALLVPDSTGGCSVSFTVHPLPGYTVRGRTEPVRASSGVRKAHLVMMRGDALPYEATIDVGADGRYEFLNVPAGYYNLQGGATGAGFEVSGNIDNLGVTFMWR